MKKSTKIFFLILLILIIGIFIHPQKVIYYPISDTFSDSRKSKQNEQEYVEKILNPILDFIKK